MEKEVLKVQQELGLERDMWMKKRGNEEERMRKVEEEMRKRIADESKEVRRAPTTAHLIMPDTTCKDTRPLPPLTPHPPARPPERESERARKKKRKRQRKDRVRVCVREDRRCARMRKDRAKGEREERPCAGVHACASVCEREARG